MSTSRRRVGELSDIKLWGQDQSPPSSYKIQVGYVELPKTISFKEKWMDAPYRFKSFSDANQEADRIFTGYNYRIVASNDPPHWDAPSYLGAPRGPAEGLSPAEEKSVSDFNQTPKLSNLREHSFKELSKLRGPRAKQVQQVQEARQAPQGKQTKESRQT